MVVKVFASGSCRLLTSINDGRDKVIPIHSMFHNFKGINFMGKLHNTKQHIQFVKYLKNDIELPDDILKSFLTSFTNNSNVESHDLLIPKKESINTQFDECSWYIFEICSLKLYESEYNGSQFEVQVENACPGKFTCTTQTEEDLLEDLRVLRGLVPIGKNVLFQCHFRPNVIHGNDAKRIENREVIHNTLDKFCKENENTYLYDPSLLLQSDRALYDGVTHFNPTGHSKSFEYMYYNYLQPNM